MRERQKEKVKFKRNRLERFIGDKMKRRLMERKIRNEKYLRKQVKEKMR